MATETVYHVEAREDGSWAVKKADSNRALRVTETKDEAMNEARQFAQRQRPSRLIVYRKDGSIQDQFTYESEGEEAAGKEMAKYVEQLKHLEIPNIDGDALWQEVKVQGDQLVERVRAIAAEGNARRVLIKKEGRILLEVPLSVGVGGAAAALIFSPVLAALGAFAALVSDVHILIERLPASQRPELPEKGE